MSAVEPIDRSIPPNYSDEISRLDQNALLKWLTRKYTDAERIYRQELERLIQIQSAIDRPIHKGGPLHMIGICLIPQRDKMEEAIRSVILAYVEDSLNVNYTEEDEIDRYPAANVLRDFFRVKLKILGEIKRLAAEKKAAGLWRNICDPEEMLNEVTERLNFDAHNILSQTIERPVIFEKQPLGFPQPWEKRVFIGGNFTRQRPNLNEIRNAAILKGLTPVIADEVYIPGKWIHHHSLMLLHTCRYAIIDVTEEAGQLMEIERVRDYCVKLLIVWAAPTDRHRKRPPRWISSMIRTLKNEMKIKTEGYTDFDQIPDIVSRFLP